MFIDHELSIDMQIALKPDNADLYCQRALMAAHRGLSGPALEDMDTAIRLEPDNARLLVTRGIMKAEWAEVHPAIDDLTSAIRLDPTLTYAYCYRALTSLHLPGAQDQAMADVQAAYKSDPNNPFHLYCLANVLIADRQFEEAFRRVDRAIKLHDNAKAEPDFYVARAQAHAELGRVRQATRDLKVALAANPNSVSALNSMALLVMEDSPERAVRHLNRSIEVSPTREAFTLRAKINADLGRDDDAVADLTAIIDNSYPDFATLSNLATLQEKSGDIAGAIATIDRIATELNDPGAAAMLRARALYEAGDTNGALAACALAAEDAEDVTVQDALTTAAFIHRREGDRERARSLLETCLARYPDCREALLALPSLLMEMNESEKASALVRRSEELGYFKYDDLMNMLRTGEIDLPDIPENPTSLHVRAYVFSLCGVGRHDDAEKMLRELIKLAPDEPSNHNELARVLIDMGRTREAEDSIASSLRAEPGNLGARFLRALIQRRPQDTVSKLREILADQPDHHDSAAELIRTLVSLGRLKEASEEMDRAAASPKEHGALALAAADLNVALGDVDATLSHIQTAIDIDPIYTTAARVMRARLLIALDRNEDAEADVREILRTTPTSDEAALMAALLALRRGDSSRAALLAKDLDLLGHDPATTDIAVMLALNARGAESVAPDIKRISRESAPDRLKLDGIVALHSRQDRRAARLFARASAIAESAMFDMSIAIICHEYKADRFADRYATQAIESIAHDAPLRNIRDAWRAQT